MIVWIGLVADWDDEEAAECYEGGEERRCENVCVALADEVGRRVGSGGCKVDVETEYELAQHEIVVVCLSAADASADKSNRTESG